jgi:crotonobetaine/carnitine-CoA ligase
MATFLTKQEDSEESRQNNLQWAYILPFTEDAIAFSSRFKVDAYTLFNMTETSVPILSGKNPSSPGICGRLRPGIEGRLVDEHDCEVSDDEGGELILRSNRPWSMNHGYKDNPEATAIAWRNGWFHTGDMFRKLPSGEYVFVDRRKDAIRRRGENISSFEVERDCVSYPQVREAAAFGVDSTYSEQDVMVVVSLVEGASIDFVEFFDYLKKRMPYFMLPRYLRTIQELPKTPTQKIMKAELRKEGITKDTWDREAHGIVVKSDHARKAKTGDRS